MLLNMMGELLEGRMPGLRDVVFIRTALMRNLDVYQPLNLKGHIRGGNLEVSWEASSVKVYTYSSLTDS